MQIYYPIIYLILNLFIWLKSTIFSIAGSTRKKSNEKAIRDFKSKLKAKPSVEWLKVISKNPLLVWIDSDDFVPGADFFHESLHFENDVSEKVISNAESILQSTHHNRISSNTDTPIVNNNGSVIYAPSDPVKTEKGETKKKLFILPLRNQVKVQNFAAQSDNSESSASAKSDHELFNQSVPNAAFPSEADNKKTAVSRFISSSVTTFDNMPIVNIQNKRESIKSRKRPAASVKERIYAAFSEPGLVTIDSGKKSHRSRLRPDREIISEFKTEYELKDTHHNSWPDLPSGASPWRHKEVTSRAFNNRTRKLEMEQAGNRWNVSRSY